MIVPAAHRLARRHALRPEDLRGEPIIVAPAGSPHRAMLERLLRELRIAVEATGWELMLQFACYGVGLAVVNDFCPAPRGMVAIPLEGAPPITYYLLERRGFTLSATAALRALIERTAGSGRVGSS